MQIVKEILNLYSKVNIKDRLHIYARLRTCPFKEIERYIPKQGRILELGCSHGIFSNWLAISSKSRKVFGIDCSEKKIRIAQGCRADPDRIFFSVGDIRRLKRDKSYDAIVMADVLYLIPFKLQEEIIKACRNMLGHQGILIIKEIDKKPFYKYLINYFQETISVKILGITTGSEFFFRSRDEYINVCKKIGFSTQSHRADNGYLHPHIIYVAKKVT